MISHYEVLGVKESADRAAIRAAYLKRIKAIHPDRARKKANDPDRATALNLAYFTLRDSRRRLAHDLELRRARNGGGPLIPVERRDVTLRRAPVPPPRPRPRSRSAVASGAILSVAIIGLGLLVADLDSRNRRPAASAATAVGSATPSRPEASPWVDRAMVDAAVEQLLLIRTRGRADDALAYSRSCFHQLDREPSALLLDHCLAFDVAAANWRRGADSPAESDFVPQAMTSRHAAALRRVAVPGSGRDRLREINLATFAALARRLRPAEPDNMPDPAGNYADASEEVALTR